MTNEISVIQNNFTDVSLTQNPQGLADAERMAENFRQEIKSLQTRSDISAKQLTVLDRIAADFEKFYTTGKQMTSVYKTEGSDSGNRVMIGFDHAVEGLKNTLDSYKQEQVNATGKSLQSLILTSSQAYKNLVLMSFLLVLVSLAIAIYLARYLGKVLGIDPIPLPSLQKFVVDVLLTGVGVVSHCHIPSPLFRNDFT